MKYEFHRYDAKHAFANETADTKKLDMLRCNPKAAEHRVAAHAVELLDRHLKK